MMKVARITLASIASLPARWGDAVNIMGCSAIVVAVLVSTLMMVSAIESTVDSSARSDWQIILRTGAPIENMSDIAEASVDALRQHLGDSAEQLERHFVTSIVSKRLGEDIQSTVQVRGVEALTKEQSPYQILHGRDFRSGQFELVVGTNASSAFSNLHLGDGVEIQNQQWRVVGIFESTGLANSELWTDLDTLMDQFGSTHYSSLRLPLLPEKASNLQNFLQAEQRLNLTSHAEDEFFQVGSSIILFEFVAYVVSAIMAFGASLAAMNVMFTAVDRRILEIATLRALGFGQVTVIASVLCESTFLSLGGGLLGIIFSMLLFHGDLHTAGSSTSITAVLTLTPAIVVTALVWSMLVGFVAGIPPAIRAVRLPIYQGLRWEN